MNQLLMQLLIILGLSKILRPIFGKIGFPRVIGELIVGILLGPVVFLISPRLHAFFFLVVYNRKRNKK
jgi:Kef-type K+ transport system membrane component KefB